MQKPFVLIAADLFDAEHIQLISSAIEGWAEWGRIPENAPVDEYAREIRRAEIVVGWPEAKALEASLVRLLLLPSAGYEDYIGQGLERKPGFTLCNSRGVYSTGIAEHFLAVLLAFCRRIPTALEHMRMKMWLREPSAYGEIAGASVCIVGLGDVGSAIAGRCACLDMRITGVRKNVSENHPFVSAIYGPDHLEAAVADADHVVAALPGGRSTAGIFNKKVLGAMKKGSYFYNFARGTVVDHDALMTLLECGHVAGAALDVFEQEPLPAASPLWGTRNILITPHIAGHSAGSIGRLCNLVIRNLSLYRHGKPPLNRVFIGGEQ